MARRAIRKTWSTATTSKPLPRTATPPRSPAHEPVELEDPLNVALDAAEQLIRNIVASGGEAPLRARLARLLPPGAGAAHPDLGGSETAMREVNEARAAALGERLA